MKRNAALILLSLNFAISAPPGALAQAPETTTTTTAKSAKAAQDPARREDVQAIQALAATFLRAFEAGDAKAVAATYTTDAQVSDDSEATRGRAAIEARYAAYFMDHAKPKLALAIDDLRFVATDVAIEEGSARVSSATPGARPEHNRYTVVYVRRGGKWLQASLHDFPTEEPSVPDRLKELEWLVGDWVNEGTEAVVHTTCRWSDDRHYLLRDFTVTVAGKPAMKGTQRIGWDPAAKQVHSWVFDSVGGFGEGYWTRAAEVWMIKAHGIHPDGKTVSATHTITRLGPNQLRWSSHDRTGAGELLEGGDEYTLVRRPPPPAPPVARRR